MVAMMSSTNQVYSDIIDIYHSALHLGPVVQGGWRYPQDSDVFKPSKRVQ